MSHHLISALALTLTLSISTMSFAHPHKDDTDLKKETPTSSLDKYFEKHANQLRETMRGETSKKDQRLRKELKTYDKGERRIEIIEDPESLRAAAEGLQEMLAKSNFLENIADMVISLAEDVEIVETKDGMSLSIDGDRLGAVNKTAKDGVSIETFGKNTTIEKEVFVENGRKKTRIIIETDADTNVEFDVVPKSKQSKNSF